MSDSTLRTYFGEEHDPLRPARWLPGGPPHLSLAEVQQDLRTYRRLRCGCCGHRGQRLEAQHTSSGRYRLLATCLHCQAQEAL